MKTPIQIIGISGRKQAGKNEIGDRLDKDGYAIQIAFADSLKRFCSDAFNISKKDLWGTDSDKNKKTIIKWENLQKVIVRNHKLIKENLTDYLTIRQVLQIFGTDICRKGFYDNIWINLTMSKIKELASQKNKIKRFVITDVRFPNEVKMIKDNGGIVIRLLRNSDDNTDRHPSETSLDNFEFDYVIDNRNMTIEEQYKKVLEILNIKR